LHKEGLGTESVRRKLRDGADLDPGEISERLDRLSEGVESLHLQRLAEETSISQETLETLLEKQDLLITAVSDLTRKMDYLLSTRARARTVPTGDGEEVVREEEILAHRAERSFEANRNAELTSSTRRYAGGADTGNLATQTVGSGLADRVEVDDLAIEVEDDSTASIFPDSPEYRPGPNRREKFGALARRRRNGILALLLLGLLAVAVPTGLLVAMGGEEAEQPGVNGDEFEQSATDEPTLEEGYPAVEESEDEEPLALEVPDFVGLTFLEAEAQLAEAGLEIGELGEEISYEIPEGKVILQEPSAGAKVEPGGQLNLVVSAGPPKIAAGPPTGDAGLTQYPIQDVALPVGDVRYPDGTVQREPFVPAVPEVS
jgi:hypothetical protein